MLGMIFRGLSFEEIREEELTMELLLWSHYCVVYPSHHRSAKGRIPKLSDFRDDNFLTFSPGLADDYEHLVRTVCRLDGEFEPKLLAVGNTADSLMSMVAAGRGVFLRPEIGLWERAQTINYHVLHEAKSRFELYIARRKNSELTATANNFVKILFEVVRRLQEASQAKSTP
jgi:DNA-binding transcriptional LysR family regulator